MPTYVYRCDACSHRFDAVQRMTEEPLVDCPVCRAPKLVKQIQAAGFALKGTGWYVTDFRDKGKKAPAESETTKSADSGEAPKPETKTETKTETKPETPKPAATGTAD